MPLDSADAGEIRNQRREPITTMPIGGATDSAGTGAVSSGTVPLPGQFFSMYSAAQSATTTTTTTDTTGGAADIDPVLAAFLGLVKAPTGANVASATPATAHVYQTAEATPAKPGVIIAVLVVGVGGYFLWKKFGHKGGHAHKGATHVES